MKKYNEKEWIKHAIEVANRSEGDRKYLIHLSLNTPVGIRWYESNGYTRESFEKLLRDNGMIRDEPVQKPEEIPESKVTFGQTGRTLHMKFNTVLYRVWCSGKTSGEGETE